MGTRLASQDQRCIMNLGSTWERPGGTAQDVSLETHAKRGVRTRQAASTSLWLDLTRHEGTGEHHPRQLRGPGAHPASRLDDVASEGNSTLIANFGL